MPSLPTVQMAVEPADCPRSPPAGLTILASLINSNFLVFCIQFLQHGLRKMAIQNVVQLLTPAPIAWAGRSLRLGRVCPRNPLHKPLSVIIGKFACRLTFRVAVAAKPAKLTELLMGKGGCRLKLSIE